MYYYAGIGSRETPKDVLLRMQQIAKSTELGGGKWTLRSGFADGADKAFSTGAGMTCDKLMEVYIPWKGFNGAPSDNKRFFALDDLSVDVVGRARYIASVEHPCWERVSEGGRKLHTRNVFQILGKTLDTPVSMVICWTSGGAGGGGTGQAIRIAKSLDIPVFDLYFPWTESELWEHVGRVEKEKNQ